MRRSTILISLIEIALIAVVASCGINPVQNLQPLKSESANFRPAYFADLSKDYIYKANISVYGHDFSGILIVKKTADTIHRAVFTTEFGNKLLDFEISDNAYKINSVVEELDRKILINSLTSDFRLMLRNSFPISSQYINAQEKILISTDKREFRYIYIDKSSGKLLKIVSGSKRKPRVAITFDSENNIFADTISIVHHNLKLTIALQHLTNS